MTNKIVFSEILQMCLKIPKLVRQKDHKKKKKCRISQGPSYVITNTSR